MSNVQKEELFEKNLAKTAGQQIGRPGKTRNSNFNKVNKVHGTVPNTAFNHGNQVLTGFSNFHRVQETGIVRDEVIMTTDTNQSSILSFYNNQPYENRSEFKIPKHKERNIDYGD